MIPALERSEAEERCGAVLTDYLAMHDRVDGLKRLAQLESWLRLREAPLSPPPTLRDCEQVLRDSEPALRREAVSELAHRRERLKDRHPARPEPPRAHKKLDGDLMNPFDMR